MNKTQLIIAIGLALQASVGYGGGYTFQADTGQLSYTFFNLGPSGVNVTPYGAGANSSGQSGSTSVSTGWDYTTVINNMTKWSPRPLSMFNAGLQTQTSYVFCNSSDYYINSPLFFASNYDPLATPASFNLGSATKKSVVEQSGQSYEFMNPPAMADSWVLSIDTNDSIVIANMASSSNMLVSHANNPTEWPFCYSYNGLWYNANLNPPDPNDSTNTIYTPPGATSQFGQWTNPLGAGFVPAGQTMNLNVSPTAPNYLPTGGLWSGINVINGSNLAVNSLNNSMYPINLSSYVVPNTGQTVSGSGSINGSSYNYDKQYYTSIYGGHFTYAIGDPYVISSFAAKMLWTWVTNPNYGFTDLSMDAADITSITNIVTGAFVSTSKPQQYTSWLMNSPNLAQSALSAATTASNTTITKESLWGKVVNGILRVGVDAGEAFAAIETGGSSLAVQMTVAGVNDATGAFGSDVTDAITNAATKVVSPPPPLAQNAPPVTNNTYASSNLFGLLLANSFVQAEINNANSITANTGSVLWDGASINADNLCLTTTAPSGSYTIQVSNSLISGSCYTTNSSGTLNNGANGTSVTTFDNTSGQTEQSYTNPLSLSDNSQSTSQISLWNTILTGADITTNSSGVMQVGNPTLPAFSPPTQMATAGGISSPITNVNTTFNLSSGIMSVASYTSTGTTTSSPVTPTVPTATILNGGTINNGSYWVSFGTWSVNQVNVLPSDPIDGVIYYNSSTGSVTMFGYYVTVQASGSNIGHDHDYPFTNGILTLDMTTCAVGSNIVLTYDTTNINYQNGSGVAGNLSCATTAPVLATGSNPVPTGWPTLTLTVSNPNGTTAYWSPTVSTTYPPPMGAYYYDTNSGTLVVNGYAGANSQTSGYYNFANDMQSFSLTNCPDDAVTLTLTPSTTSGNASGASGTLSCTTSTTNWPALTLAVGATSANPVISTPTVATASPPAIGSYYYDPSTATLTVNGYLGTNSNTAYAFANGAQSLSMSNCEAYAAILTITLPTNTTASNPSGATGTLSCGSPYPITVVNAAASATNNTIQPASVSYSGTTLTVGGFTVGTGAGLPVTQFTNINPSLPAGALTLDTSTCNQSIIRSTLAYNSTSGYTTNYATVPLNVTLTVYPIGTSNASAMGVLSCQSPPTLSYNACTSDPNATGGVIAVLTGPALPNPQGPMFELACACVPPSPYMDGPNPVASNATTTQSNFTSNNFIATGGNDSNGNPNGVVVGATSTYPSQQCPTNW